MGNAPNFSSYVASEEADSEAEQLSEAGQASVLPWLFWPEGALLGICAAQSLPVSEASDLFLSRLIPERPLMDLPPFKGRSYFFSQDTHMMDEMIISSA